MDLKNPAPAAKPNSAAKANNAVKPNGPADAASAGKPQRAPRRLGKKAVVLSMLGLLLAGGSAGGAWYVVQQRKPDGVQAAQHPKQAQPLFANLDPFTVNLQDPYSERVAQIGITLQFDDPTLEVRIKERLPAVRNTILLLISSKRVDELVSTEGKEQLAQQIRVRSAQALGFELREPLAPAPAAAPAAGAKAAAASVPVNPISAVLFSQFLVQ